MTKKKIISRLFSDLMKQKWKLLAALTGTVMSALLGILYPMLIAETIEEVIGDTGRVIGGFSLFSLLLAALLVIFLLRGIFGYMQEYVMASVSQKLVLDMRKRFSDKLNRLPLKYFDTHKKGDILSHVTTDLEKVADTIQGSLSQLFSSVVAMAGAVLMMFLLNWVLALVVIFTVVVSFLVVGVLSGRTNRIQKENQNALGAFNAGIEEIFTGNVVVKAFGQQENMNGKVMEMSETLYRTGRKAQFITFIINPMIQLLNHLGYVVVAFGGAMLVISGGISIAYIPAFFQYTNKSSESIMMVAYLINNLQGAVAAAGRVYEFLDEEEQEADTGAVGMIGKARGEVRFEHIRFGYSADSLLMNDISLSIPAGSKIAVVGPTGAGKTTLVNLLMRFYELNGGRITIDGTDISQIPRSELYSVIGMVLQDTWLFRGTIAENIAYGKKEAGMEEIVSAAKAARADYFIRTMPKGYDTVLDEEDTAISAGQKQLLTIARALLADPQILILDEATSSVDTRIEAEIQKAMNHLMTGRTSFLIAHRLSTIRDADCILVMQNGSIVEHGTHKELIQKKGFYYELYNAQFAGQKEEAK